MNYIVPLLKKRENMPIPQGAGALLGIGLNAIGQSQQMQNQEHLMNVQHQNQMHLNEQGAQLARDNWDYTNYENQVKHMQNAGLNIGLMYDGGGQSGTLSSGSGGSAAAGNAPQNNMSQAMGIGLQAEALASQIELNKANANKANAEADSTKGGEGTIGEAQIGSLTQGIENGKANQKLTEIESNIKSVEERIINKTEQVKTWQIIAEADKAQSEARSALVDANVDEKTLQTKIDTLNQNYANMVLQNAVMRSGIEVNKAQIEKMSADILQGWKNLDLTEKRTRIETFNAEINAQYKGVNDIIGKNLDETLRALDDIMGVGNEANDMIRKVPNR